ncbi:phosphoribosyltransferase family protein [Mucilaginibacter sp. Bleaf8]|uniref:phosphoribosyltransferase family protein n=1 Tax=Mucilaginibacter sp. Bleaf8 TaxID=2834430 RepID=UPI001BCBA9E2|nr:phosphoribosyltransferase family protein [Mucilaginibacter sp. Bleaf8]MBS7564974.1 phosphoribosyltransferase family protein [Mucilaginibacter sp. Bleaf8]
MNTTWSLHKISDTENFGFSPAQYSRFKFGDDTVAEAFGTALADGFIKAHLEQGHISGQMVVISSPYSFIPTATYAMKNYFLFRINHWLAENDLPVVQEAKVHRTITYKEDYGELNAEERMRLIGNDSFHIDKAFIAGKTLLFLDDIKITGSHERMIMKMVRDYDLHNTIYMLYFAELVNDSIHPNIENYLNYHQVSNIFDLDDIVKSGSFCINTRLVKYLLNYNYEAFCVFIQAQSRQFILNLYNMALGNGYHTMDSYRPNLKYIKDQLFTNNKLLAQYGN